MTFFTVILIALVIFMLIRLWLKAIRASKDYPSESCPHCGAELVHYEETAFCNSCGYPWSEE